MSLTVEQLVELVQAPALSASGAVPLVGVASLDEAKVGEVSFLGNLKYEDQLKTTGASVVLVPERVEPWRAAEGVTLIAVPNPSASFSRVVDHFLRDARPFEAGAHATAWVAEDVVWNSDKVQVGPGAVVESGAELGDGTVIGANVTVGRGVKIGRNCLLHAQSVVREGCVLGDRVALQPNAVVGSDGFGYEFVAGRHEKVPQVGIVVLEDEVEVGANTTIDRARFGVTRIGKGTKIDNLVQIAHNCEIGEHCLITAQCGVAGSTKIGNLVTMGAQSGIAGHLKIGNQVMLAARSGVLRSLPDGGTYMGYPARPMEKEQKKMAALARVPRLLVEIRELKRKLKELSSG